MDFRPVLAVLVDVLLVLDEPVLNHPLQRGVVCTQLRQAMNHILHQVVSVQIVQNCHIEVRCDGAIFLIAVNMYVFPV